jgi:triosephosphate isomerase (TIM)
MTTAGIRPLVAGNWKMNGLLTGSAEISAVISGVGGAACDLMICPPATLLVPFAHAHKGQGIAFGGQDCHAAATGAHTGDVSAEMLADAGATAVILGHSERRADHGETDKDVRAKAMAAYRAGLVAIICVGETHGQRRAGLTLEVVGRQLAGSLPETASVANTVIAYEPVWAIGTGLVPEAKDVAEVHAFIRSRLGDRGTAMRVLYGGSVKPSNAKELLSIANVDGALVGGASLKAADFLGIIAAYRS